jgi:phosphoribosylformylglycinamidine synthase
VISGNVSLYNESFEQPIYPTAVVGMLGVMDDVTAHCTIAFKDIGDQVFLLGNAAPVLDGSEYQKRWYGGPKGRPAGRIPDVDLAAEVALQKVVRDAIAARLLKSAHDIADGGLAITLAESCVTGRIGADVRLGETHFHAEGHTAHVASRPDIAFFGETPTLVVVSAAQGDAARLKEACTAAHVPCNHLGTVGGKDLVMNVGALGEHSAGLKVKVAKLEDVYESALPRAMGE